MYISFNNVVFFIKKVITIISELFSNAKTIFLQFGALLLSVVIAETEIPNRYVFSQYIILKELK